MKKTKCNSKDDLMKLLKIWLKTNEQKIGNGEIMLVIRNGFS